MSDLDRFVTAVQQLRLSMQAAQMQDVDHASIRLSTDDGFRLEHMIRQSEQLISVEEHQQSVGLMRHIAIDNIKIWWFVPNISPQTP